MSKNDQAESSEVEKLSLKLLSEDDTAADADIIISKRIMYLVGVMPRIIMLYHIIYLKSRGIYDYLYSFV